MKATNKLYAGVHGRTVIDHRIRCKLGLTVDEYVVLDFIYCQLKPGEEALEESWKRIGMQPEEMNTILKGLNTRKIEAITEWNAEFAVDSDFEEFWTNIFKKHGNRKDSEAKYAACRKLVDKSILHSRALRYVETRPDFPNFTKAAEVWLNPKKRHWEDRLPGDPPENSNNSATGIIRKSSFPGIKQ